MPRFQITHKTAYAYEEPVSLCYNEGRLLPRTCYLPLFEQECRMATLRVEPEWNDHRERMDFFGNRVIYFTQRHPHERMVLTAQSDVVIRPAFAATVEPAAILAEFTALSGEFSWEATVARLTSVPPDHHSGESVADLYQYRLPSPFTPIFPAVTAFAQRSFTAGRPLLDAVADLMARIYHDFAFVAGVTTIATPLAEVLAQRKGVCQDFAHLMIACLRSQGLAARYVSGYIETIPPPGQVKLEGSDASHAWCAVYVPAIGWVDFDPTNNLIPQEQHVVLGWGRDFGDVTPLKGVFFGSGRHELTVAVDMKRMG
ncbi:MAG: transglutaminase family protein, partial [Anaerolineae bacterium]|nr:transglutaminase family protein [Anaerolineae bacterium]